MRPQHWALAVLAITVVGACGVDPPNVQVLAEPAVEVSAAVPSIDPPPSVPAEVPPPPTSPAGCDEPTRVLGIGDSIAAQAVGPTLDELANVGYHTTLDARWGTGLLDTQPDWVTLARGLAITADPDIVLVLFYGNYAQPVVDFAGRPIPAGSVTQLELWADRARQLTQTFLDVGASVVWIMPPPEPPSNGGVGQIPRVWAYAMTTVRELPGVTTVASGRLLAGENGAWVASVADDSGRRRPVRDPDRVHLLPYSADLVAADVVRHVLALNGPVGACER